MFTMQSRQIYVRIAFVIVTLFACLWFVLQWSDVWARNISQYRDTISHSAPGAASNHTLSFIIDTEIPANGSIVIVPPAGFELIGDVTFSPERNVQLAVDGAIRTVGAVQTDALDQVSITPGIPGEILYKLNTTTAIPAGSALELRIGNHTVLAETGFTAFSTTTGTTTVPADVRPIINSTDVGTHEVQVRVRDGADVEIAQAGFLIALVHQVGVGPVDTTEDIPPERFNGSPSGQLSGTTVGVEIYLETNEFSTCRYSLSPDVSFDDMVSTFTNTGLIYHTEVVSVIPDSVNRFYIKCMDDENNQNIDDYVIEFTVNARPTGSSNTDGDVSGNGTGTGNDGSGNGDNSGGTTGGGSGEAPTEGSSSGSGGSGGGGGGGSGGGSGGGGGGGFEGTNAPFRSGDGEVVISGTASPRAKITALVDGKVAGNATANASGEYTLTISAIARGAYTFGVFATDVANTKSSTFSTSFTVAGARTSALSNVNVPPSILVNPDPVNPGQPLTISGYTLPNATVTIENEKDKSASTRKSFTVQAGANGAWSLPVDTSGFTSGTYKVRAKAVVTGGITTNFSQPTLYGVGQTAARGGLNSDLNRDGKINLTDFSILLFWWGGDGGNSNPPADISQDGKVNLTDFSILLFNWTG